MRSSLFGFGVLSVSAAMAVAPPRARAEIVDRIVAVIDRDVVTLVELRARARPFTKRILDSTTDPAQRAAALSQLMKEIVRRIVAERLVARAADAARITATSEEIDRAILSIASNAGISVAALHEELKKQDMTLPEYREEIRRQILEGKMVQLRVRPSLVLKQGATEAEILEALTKGRDKWVEELQRDAYVDLRL